MSKRSNALVAELFDLGLTDGVKTKVTTTNTPSPGSVTVQVDAGPLTATSTTVPVDNSAEERGAAVDLAHEQAFRDLRDQIKALPKAQRPKWHQSTTRRIARHSIPPDGTTLGIEDLTDADGAA